MAESRHERAACVREEARYRLGLEQGHRAPSEASAGHPRAQDSAVAMRLGDRDEQIELRTGDLEEVPQGAVTLEHELACGPEITALQGGGESGDPRGLADHVSRTSADPLRQVRRLDQPRIRLGEELDVEPGPRLLAVGTSGGVAAVAEFVSGARVEDQHDRVARRRHGNPSERIIATVDEAGMSGSGRRGHVHVHDPARRSGLPVFRALRLAGEFEDVHGATREVAHPEENGHLERGTRTQAATHRDRAGDHEIHPRHLEAATPQFVDRPRDVVEERVRSVGGGGGPRLREVQGPLLRDLGRTDAAEPVVRRPETDGDRGSTLDGDRQHEPACVVDVITDEIDPTRSDGDHVRSPAVPLSEDRPCPVDGVVPFHRVLLGVDAGTRYDDERRISTLGA